MFSYDITDHLRKKLKVLGRKDKVLARVLKRKLLEVVSRDEKSINSYKNLRSPLHEYKRIHLTDNYILIFFVNAKKRHVVFIDIIHRDKAYKMSHVKI